ncbi:MAG TPA: hypothetical protein VFA64_08580 [Hyphomicrobiaceae bacterium]|nr:hypothetical protein [Hyphomicrobiaceae bacterium]
MSRRPSIGAPVQSARAGLVPERLSSPFRLATRTLRLWLLRSTQRRALRELAEEGHLLADIGLTRAQALREAAKPFWRA